jgi:hypothetical protein
LAAAAAVAPGITTPAAAHSSSYCGHGISGIVDLTIFIRHFDNFQQGFGYRHYHVYSHVMSFGAENHSVTKYCPH